MRTLLFLLAATITSTVVAQSPGGVVNLRIGKTAPGITQSGPATTVFSDADRTMFQVPLSSGQRCRVLARHGNNGRFYWKVFYPWRNVTSSDWIHRSSATGTRPVATGRVWCANGRTGLYVSFEAI